MIKLILNVGRSYDGYGEQVVKKETVVLTDEEARYYLTQFVEAMGTAETRKWIKAAKEIN